MGKLLILSGVILIVAGIIVMFLPRNFSFGKLPGDIVIERENGKLYLPITTSILASILLTIIILIINRLR